MALPEALLAEISACLSSATVVRHDEPLGKRTTLRVGGPADCYIEPASEEELSRLLQVASGARVPVMILGRGSNLLIRDGGIRGIVVCLAHPTFSQLRIEGERVWCGAGVRLKTLAVEARRHGLGGFEFLEGVPGSLGGALRMNAGAMGSWIFDVVERVRVMDACGCVTEHEASEISVEYRRCPLFADHIALGAALRGSRTEPRLIAERMRQFSERRWASQPAAPSAGCIFKNPPGIPAGKLIDELGLKGTRVGAAVVSPEHANFIVNEGQATAQDVLDLIRLIRQRAKAERNIELETEVEILGEPAAEPKLPANREKGKHGSTSYSG